MARPRLRFSVMLLHSVSYLVSVSLVLAQNALDPTGFSFAQHQFDRSNLTLLQDAYVGNALAPKQNNASNTLILIPSRANAAGRALDLRPIRVRNATTSNVLQFSTNFTFSTTKELAEHSGEGMAFIMAPDNVTTGLDAGYLAWLNNATQGNSSGHNFAVEFDTTKTAWCDDPDDNHVGINVNSLVSVRTQGSGFYTGNGTNPFVEIDLSVDNPLYVWIDYNYVLNVTVAMSPSKPPQPLISYEIDLSGVLNEFMYVGFTSSTEAYDNSTTNVTTEVYEWSFQTGADVVPPGLANADVVHRPTKFTILIILAVWVSLAWL